MSSQAAYLRRVMRESTSEQAMMISTTISSTALWDLEDGWLRNVLFHL